MMDLMSAVNQFFVLLSCKHVTGLINRKKHAFSICLHVHDSPTTSFFLISCSLTCRENVIHSIATWFYNVWLLIYAYFENWGKYILWYSGTHEQFLYEISFGNSFIKLEFVTHNQWGIGFIFTTASFN